jgi:hypothetical protein
MPVPAIPGGLPPLSGGAGGASGPATGYSDSVFDSSGWSVTFGDNSPVTPAQSLKSYIPWAIAGVGLLIAWKIYKK